MTGNALVLQGRAERIPLPDDSVDFVMGSPPYMGQRWYLEDGKNIGIALKCRAWVEWMLVCSREAVRVSRGPVVWVMAGPTKNRNYWPGPEGLIWRWYESGGQQETPVYWHRVGIPGSGGDQWFRKDVEYCVCFKKTPKFPWSDNTANGHTPRWAPGGAMSHRVTDGTRRNQWGAGERSGAHRGRNGEQQAAGRPSHRMQKGRKLNGEPEFQAYAPPSRANPGNLLSVKVGGGHMGNRLAHQNEAPYPERLVDWFVASLCPPGGTVLDPFGGSGTTVASAVRLGRHGIAMDRRASQCSLAALRISRPHAPVVKTRKTRVKPDVPPLLRGTTP